MPLLFVGIAYWAIGFSLGHVLGLKIGLGATGIWIGLSIRKNIYTGPLVLRFPLRRAGVHSEPSLDCVMAVLGERESRNARRLRGSLRLQRGQGVRLETKFLTAQSPAVPCLCKGTSKPICRPSLTSISSLATTRPQASKELARPKSRLAHSLQPMLPASTRSSASSGSSPVTPIRHRRARQESAITDPCM